MRVSRKQQFITVALLVALSFCLLFSFQLLNNYQKLGQSNTFSIPSQEEIAVSAHYWSDVLLSIMLQYTAAAVPVSMFLGGLGLPLPNSMIVIVLGTLAQQQLLELASLSWLVVLPTIVGDISSFLLFRWLSHKQQLPGIFRSIFNFFSQSERSQTVKFFTNYGSWSIFLSRFAVTPLAVPVTFAAAASGYSFRKFLTMAVMGELIWAGMYAGVGYTFGIHWQTVYQLLNSLVGLLSAAAMILLLLGITTTRQRRKRNLRANQSTTEAVA